MAGMKCMTIDITRNYGKDEMQKCIDEWRDSLKRVVEAAGVEGQPVVFLFSDTQVAHESFLEDVNSLLNAGEVRAKPSPCNPAPCVPCPAAYFVCV